MMQFLKKPCVAQEFKYKVSPRQNFIRALTYEDALHKILDYVKIEIQSIHENTLFSSPESIANPDFE